MKYVSVLIVNQSIKDAGLLVNAAFVLGLSAGKGMPGEAFGSEVEDGDGRQHAALTNIGHFVRKASASKLATLRNTMAERSDVAVVDYTEDAAPADYTAYVASLGQRSGNEIVYRAVHLYGPEVVIVPATKNLSQL